MTVRCPSCSTRLKIPPRPGPPRPLRVRCGACAQEFRVRPKRPEREAPGPERPSGSGVASAGGPTRSVLSLGSETVGTVAPRGSFPSGSAPGPRLAPGDVLVGRYCIVRFLAQGGMGDVYEAEDLELGDRVALKSVRPAMADEATVRRFKREIQLARRVTHPNVSRIFDLFRHGGTEEDGEAAGVPVLTFLTMELLGGETLRDRIKSQGPLSTAEALPLAEQMAAGLGAAHDAGVIHRDFKSRNVMLEGEPPVQRVVITDFGLARPHAGDPGDDLTVRDVVIGTPAYMAPEQVEGGEITPAADLYAFGVVLYEMVTGQVPFEGDTALSTAVQRLQAPPPPPRIHAPDLEERWERVILKCLERRPEDRFPGPREAVAALKGPPAPSFQGHRGGHRASDPPRQPPPPAAANLGSGTGELTVGKSRREKVMAAGLGLLILLIALFAWRQVAAWRADRAPRLAAGLAGGSIEMRPSVAVLGLRDLSSTDGESLSDDAWVGTALAELVKAELAAGRQIQVVPAETVAQAQGELGLSPGPVLDRDLGLRLLSLTGAQYLLTGAFQLEPSKSGDLILELSLFDRAGIRSAKGEVPEPLLSLRREGQRDQLPALVRAAGEDLRAPLRLGPVGEALAALPEDADAARLYAQGLDRLRQQDALGARQLLERAVNADPTYAMAHSALAGAWSSLGYSSRARQAAAKAFELSGSLKREERLWVEARYRELNEDWAQAATLYLTLWNEFPDDSDYGLQLANAQTAAGDGRAALRTVEALRSLPGPVRDDPRVDLAEAQAARSLADFERQRRAAAAAAAKGQAQHSQRRVASAKVLEAVALRNLGRFREAAAAAEEARRRSSEIGDDAGTALALNTLSAVRFDQGDLDAAAQDNRRALEIFARLGDDGGRARTLNNLAVLARRGGDLEQAGTLYDESLELIQRLGSPVMEAYSLGNLAGIHYLRGELSRAQELYQDALELRRQSGDRAGEAAGLDNLAVVLRAQGDLAGAQDGHERSLALWRAVGQPTGEATAQRHLAQVQLCRGELDAAEGLFQDALATGRRIANRGLTAASHFGLGQVAFGRGDLDGAEAELTESLELRLDLGEDVSLVESRVGLAEVLLEAGFLDGAESHARRAASDLSDAGLTDHQALADAVLARILLAQGRVQQADAAIARAKLLADRSESRETRWPVAIAHARLQASRGQPHEAMAALDALLEDLEATPWLGLQLEARLVRWETELAYGRARIARRELELLEIDARTHGYALTASRAGEYLR